MANKQKNRRHRRDAPIELNLSAADSGASNKSSATSENEFNAASTTSGGWLTSLKRHWWAFGIIALLALGAFGAGLKYLDEAAKQEKAANAGKSSLQKSAPSLLSKVNPFAEAPPPSATPQLSKSYIYAGSRMLAVEDANANAAPPADLAVWRPSTGYWYVLGGTGSQQTAFAWGGAGDKPAPGDFDGDGKTDFSVFRPSTAAGTGTWYVNNSSNGNTTELSYGAADDKLAQADYDGDGKTDFGVFRPSNGYWYIVLSSTQASLALQYGLGSDKPAAADYDGDGRADLGVWRESSQSFYYASSANNGQTVGIPLAATGGETVSADYDGDGRADAAVRSGSVWHLRNSSNGQAVDITWQSAVGSQQSVQNDYDGDGKVDIAVWSSTDGNWYIRQSSHVGQSNELRQVQWGAGTDVPVPAFYRR